MHILPRALSCFFPPHFFCLTPLLTIKAHLCRSALRNHLLESRITQEMTVHSLACVWVCACVCMCYYRTSAEQSLNNNLIEGHSSVILLVLFLSGRRVGKIAELHLPTLLLFQLMVGAVKPSQGFHRTSWHPPRPPKHDGWESWGVDYRRSVKKKKTLGCCCL